MEPLLDEKPPRISRNAQRTTSSPKWKRSAAYTLAVCWVVGSAVAMWYAATTNNGLNVPDHLAACSADGTFVPFYTSKSSWRSSQFFAINVVAARSLSFSAAKVIDVAWDLIGGRGLAVLMALLSYNVFRQYLTVTMRRHPATYRVFQAVYLESEPTLSSTYQLLKDCIASRRRVLPPTALAFMVATMAFTLLFPTLSGSMTGYINVSTGFVQAAGGAMVPFESLDFVAYVIHDGWRVNLTGNYIISLGAEGGHKYEGHDDSWLSPVVAGAAMQMCRDEKDPNCQLKNSTSFYTWQYGFYGLRNETTVWSTDRGQVTLPAPSLNISAFYLDNIHTDPTVATSWTGWGYGNEWVDPRTGHQPFSYKERVAWTAANQTFDMDQIVANASCQPVQNQYQWGFSLTQLLIAITLVALWTTGLCVMHYTSSRHNPLEGGQPEVLRGWRALLTLAEAMNLELASAGIEPYGMRDDELQQQIDRHIGGGRVHSKSSRGDDAIQRRGFPVEAGDR